MEFMNTFLITLVCILCGYLEVAVGIGADTLLHILWAFLADFLSTPYKGGFSFEPVKTVTKLLYIRHLVINSLALYHTQDRSVFSRRVVQFMAAAYAATAVIGTLCFTILSESISRLLLGVFSLTFLACTILFLGKRIMEKRKKLSELRDNGIPISRECDLAAEQPANLEGKTGGDLLTASSRRPFTFPINWKAPSEASPPLDNRDSQDTTGAPQASQRPAVPVPPLSEAYLSTVTNELFYARESVPPVLTEDFVPPLTPSKLSPSATMTFTRVRINRAVEDGRISRRHCMGGIAAAAVAGAVSSLVGVSSSPLFLFVSMFNLPSYLFGNIIIAHEIPGSAIRIVIAVCTGVYAPSHAFLLLLMIPYVAGMLIGLRLGGRTLGRRSTLLFFCCVLFGAGAILISRSTRTVVVLLLGSLAIVGISTYFERLRIRDELRLHYEVQHQREERQRQTLETLHREYGHILHSGQGEAGRVPYWAGYDNDDDRDYGAPAGRPHGGDHTARAAGDTALERPRALQGMGRRAAGIDPREEVASDTAQSETSLKSFDISETADGVEPRADDAVPSMREVP